MAPHDRSFRALAFTAALGLAVVVTACSKNEATGPSDPPPASAAGNWSGSASDQSGAGTMTWVLTQNGSAVSGSMTMTDQGSGVTGRGSVSGTVTGSTLQFTLTVPAGGFDAPFSACTTNVNGSASVSATALSGTYTGSSSCQAIATGQFTLNKQ